MSRSALLEVPMELAYQVVQQVERYPEFLPGCEAVKVKRQGDRWLEAEVTVSGMGMTQKFSTRNEHSAGAITMALIKGPLKSLYGNWRFVQIGDIGCRVEVDIDFEFDGMLSMVFAPVADRAANVLVDAFTERMEDLAGGAI